MYMQYVHWMYSTMYIECTFSLQHMTAYCTIWTWLSYIICTMHVNSMYLCCVLMLCFDLIYALVYASIYAYILNNVVPEKLLKVLNQLANQFLDNLDQLFWIHLLQILSFWCNVKCTFHNSVHSSKGAHQIVRCPKVATSCYQCSSRRAKSFGDTGWDFSVPVLGSCVLSSSAAYCKPPRSGTDKCILWAWTEPILPRSLPRRAASANIWFTCAWNARSDIHLVFWWDL